MIVGVNVVLNVLGTMTGSYGKPNTLFVGLMGLCGPTATTTSSSV